MRDIQESDWKLLRRLKPVALDRFCQRVLSDIQSTGSDAAATAHERYLRVFRLIQEEDNELGRIFNDLRRSTAVLQATMMRTAGLITDEEFAEFSEELRDTIEKIRGL